MCLSIPGQITQIEGDMAKVSVQGVLLNVALHLVDGAKVGDYVLVHAGFALQIIDIEHATEIIQAVYDNKQNKQ
jgi:hydrogenase expression/formation protein HypC